MLSDRANHVWGTESESAKERGTPFGFPRFLFSSPALWSLLSVICGNSKACTVTISFFNPPPSTVKTHFLISRILRAPHGGTWDIVFPVNIHANNRWVLQPVWAWNTHTSISAAACSKEWLWGGWSPRNTRDGSTLQMGGHRLNRGLDVSVCRTGDVRRTHQIGFLSVSWYIWVRSWRFWLLFCSLLSQIWPSSESLRSAQ